MSLKAVLTTLDGVGDDIKKLYVEKDGKFILDVESVAGWSLEDVGSLKSALAKERNSARELKDAIGKLGDVKPDDVASMVTELDRLRKAKPGDLEAETVKSHIKQLTDKHTKEVTTRDERIKSIMSQLERTLKTEAATRAIAEKKASVPLLLPIVERQIRMRELQDGRFVTEIVDDSGNPRITSRSGSQDPMTLSELIEEMSKVDTYAPAFPGSGASGSGSPGSSGGSKNGAYTLSGADARDPAKYRAAKAAAEKAGVPLEVSE